MPEELVPGVHRIELGDRFCAYVDVGSTPTLFDAGLPDTTDDLFAGIEAIGTDPERVVLTHGDFDHSGGLPAVCERYDVDAYVPTETDLAEAVPGGEDAGDAIDPYRYGDGDRIDPYEAVHVPGHRSDNHVLVDEARGIAVMGDAVSGSDQRGLPGGYLLLPPAVYSEDLNEAERNLERLLEYEFDAALTYHGSPVLEDAGAKLERFVEFPGKPD